MVPREALVLRVWEELVEREVVQIVPIKEQVAVVAVQDIIQQVAVAAHKVHLMDQSCFQQQVQVVALPTLAALTLVGVQRNPQLVREEVEMV